MDDPLKLRARLTRRPWTKELLRLLEQWTCGPLEDVASPGVCAEPGIQETMQNLRVLRDEVCDSLCTDPLDEARLNAAYAQIRTCLDVLRTILLRHEQRGKKPCTAQ